MYKYFKKLLFCFQPETAHKISMLFLKKMTPAWFPKVPERPLEVLGLKFKNPVGLAAGFDKNGDYIDELGKLGFGFIEVGTVTPKPQIGNPRPRLFRLPKKQALINRMGFNNFGVDYLVERLKVRKYTGIIGVNIGKNADTPIDEAVEDYIICLKKVYPYADYITINISSPNTKNLRQLQQGEHLNCLLLAVSDIRSLIEKEQGIHKPILLKISPDETPETLEAIVDAVHRHKIDGIIATNTTVDKTLVKNLPHSEEAGGLSGFPLFEQSNQTLEILRDLINQSNKKIALIGVGGITRPSDVQIKFEAGAQLVQVYTGFIYHGPLFVKRLVSCLSPNKVV